jgi:hypothetical protein
LPAEIWAHIETFRRDEYLAEWKRRSTLVLAELVLATHRLRSKLARHYTYPDASPDPGRISNQLGKYRRYGFSWRITNRWCCCTHDDLWREWIQPYFGIKFGHDRRPKHWVVEIRKKRDDEYV